MHHQRYSDHGRNGLSGDRAEHEDDCRTLTPWGIGWWAHAESCIYIYMVSKLIDLCEGQCEWWYQLELLYPTYPPFEQAIAMLKVLRPNPPSIVKSRTGTWRACPSDAATHQRLDQKRPASAYTNIATGSLFLLTFSHTPAFSAWSKPLIHIIMCGWFWALMRKVLYTPVT